jgi:hypothetical protein
VYAGQNIRTELERRAQLDEPFDEIVIPWSITGDAEFFRMPWEQYLLAALA